MNPGPSGRMTLRFPVQAPVRFWWTDGNGKSRQGEGRSRDISEHGAFVFAPICPPVGARVLLKIVLEGIPEGVGPLPIEVNGEVRRVEQSPIESATGGFAIEY